MATSDFFYLEDISKKLFLSIKDKFEVFSIFKEDVQKFANEQAAIDKLKTLNLTQNSIRIVHVVLPVSKQTKKDE